MKQTGNASGALWCHGDLLNIFSRPGHFHMEKNVNFCPGKYLKSSDIGKVLINTNIYGPI